MILADFIAIKIHIYDGEIFLKLVALVSQIFSKVIVLSVHFIF